MAESLTTILASEARLINEAAEALPHQFSACTYSLGYIRQAVYLCLTCALSRGICSACSIACHTDHEQVELFPKRHFRCDCPTSALTHACTLHTNTEEENTENKYGQNFEGVFCRCGRPYDANNERETMIQCLACEDWLHESCLNLRERPSSREPTPGPKPEHPSLEVRIVEPNAVDDNADDTSEASSSGLPPPLITDAEYDSLICGSCVRKNPTLCRWAGTKGAMMVTRDAINAPWAILDGISEDNQIVLKGSTVETSAFSQSEAGARSAVGHKRTIEAVSDKSEDSDTKRPRTRDGIDACADASESHLIIPPCLAPPRPPKVQKIIDCLPPLKAQYYLLEEEETYEPPEDPDSADFTPPLFCEDVAFSLEELGMRALQSLPRDRALDGIRAFNEMRDDLLSYLRPFAREGKVVNEADVNRFFEEKQEARRANRE
ncbi:hypothetical protein EW145_g2547 [Phellinidium pouzarii]|uniref:UBR-type domain-containing protein n=1 Tax=Phellinidium pouzarii TaxID=167371 RepID=A0A4S4LAI8_9AGAM|nr:hypothetical protein EW145_g2547 [Phellinidium pouzarii]